MGKAILGKVILERRLGARFRPAWLRCSPAHEGRLELLPSAKVKKMHPERFPASLAASPPSFTTPRV